MNVFILSTGRCGSTTFTRACQHISNYTSAHESRLKLIGTERLAYPDNHIESDNRLSWILGRLEQRFGDNAFYIHLSRDRHRVAESYARRSDFGIMQAYREGILLGGHSTQTNTDLAYDYIETIETNINIFLQNKTKTMKFEIENARDDFVSFWNRIDADGDINQALQEWDIHYNAS